MECFPLVSAGFASIEVRRINMKASRSQFYFIPALFDPKHGAFFRRRRLYESVDSYSSVFAKNIYRIGH